MSHNEDPIKGSGILIGGFFFGGVAILGGIMISSAFNQLTAPDINKPAASVKLEAKGQHGSAPAFVKKPALH